MKKFLTFLLLACMCLTIQAKKPVVEQPDEDMSSRIEVINDSTIIYYHVYGIQVAQPADVYTGIFELASGKRKPMKLMTMNSGAYIWTTPGKVPGCYILYASKAFDRVILRAKEE